MLEQKAVEFKHPVRVFVTNLGWHDFDPARRWGELIPVTQGNVDLRHTDRLRARIVETLKDINEHDYILLSGHPLIVGEVFAYVLQKLGKVNYLYWEPLMRSYVPRSTTGKLTGFGNVETA